MQITLSWHLHVLTGMVTHIQSACCGMSTCLLAFLSDNLGLLPKYVHVSLPACLPTCLSVYMPVSFVCLSLSWAATGIVYPPQNVGFCWQSDGKQMKIGLLDSCPDCPNPSVKRWQGPLADTLCGYFSTHRLAECTMGECRPNVHLMEKQILRPIQVSEQSHWLKIELYASLGSTFYDFYVFSNCVVLDSNFLFLISVTFKI